MQKSIYVVLISSLVLLAGCNQYESKNVSTKQYEVLKINPPKRFYVDLKDVSTGVVHKNVYISKRCIPWKKLKIGSQWELEEISYFYKDGEIITKISNASTICNKLRDL